MKIIKEFRDFAMRGNVVDMAVGIIIGAAFGAIVSSLVEKVFMPPIGMLLAGIDFASLKLVLQEAVPAVTGPDGATLTPAKPMVAIFYGEFINAVIKFVVVAFVLFMVIKAMNTARDRFEKKAAQAPAAPPPPPPEVALLAEIRDLLRGDRA